MYPVCLLSLKVTKARC